ncbi:MAG: hypothetical protein ABIJ08_05010 [Nanoarchaeota archaeon]
MVDAFITDMDISATKSVGEGEQRVIYLTYNYYPVRELEQTEINDGIVNDDIQDIKPHKFLRCFFKKEDNFPVPGELLCLAMRAMRLAQVWWYQETNPFLYSANWFEMTFYTTGIIEEKIKIEDAKVEYDYGGYVYKVRWHGLTAESVEEYIEVESTDFKEYEVGERVAIIREVGSNEKTMDWKKTPDSFWTEWRLAPLSFYQKEE